MACMDSDLDRVLISEDAIEKRVAELAHEVLASYAESESGITIVTVLAGSIVFLADLIRQLPMRMRVGLISASNYPGKTTVPQGVVLGSISLPELRDRDVLIVDDILDSGGTLRAVQAEMQQAGPRSLKTAVLLRKPGTPASDIIVDFVGFDIEDVFVVGYGLDYDGLYRNLPYVAVLSPQAYGSE